MTRCCGTKYVDVMLPDSEVPTYSLPVVSRLILKIRAVEEAAIVKGFYPHVEVFEFWIQRHELLYHITTFHSPQIIFSHGTYLIKVLMYFSYSEKRKLRLIHTI